ncbi:MAG: preprotein translocase subunit YajC [Anaerovoracaceae bacterium]|jgi:preprotein translocase subunit YajC
MSSSSSSFLTVFLPLILFFVIMWLFLVRPQRKKEKETKEMRNNLKVGDEITTIGGIIGKVLAVKDDSIVIYCGSDKTKMEFKKWAVAEVTNKDPRALKAEKAAEKAEKAEKEREEKAAEEEKEAAPKIRKLSRKDENSDK